MGAFLLRSMIFLLAMGIATETSVAQERNKKADTKKPDTQCGAKCLYVILRTYGKSPLVYKELVKELGPSGKDGYSLLQLKNAALAREVSAECVKIDSNVLRKIAGKYGIILHLSTGNGVGTGHYVLCENVSPSSVSIMDPSNGTAMEVSNELLTRWSGNTLIVSDQEISFPANDPPPAAGVFRRVVLACICVVGLCIVGLCVFGRMRGLMRLRPNVWLLACSLVAGFSFGCSPKNRMVEEKQDVPANEIVEQTSESSQPIQSSGIWAEVKEHDAGVLRRDKSPWIVTTKIYNSEVFPVSIQNVNFSCGCLYGDFSGKTIEPKSSVDFRLQMTRSKVGMQSGTASVLFDNNEYLSVNARWIVVANLSGLPSTISGLEMQNGETKRTSVQLVQLEPTDMSKLQAKAVVQRSHAKEYLSAKVQLDEDRCEVLFTALEDTPAGLYPGHVDITSSIAPEVSLEIPFTVYVNNEIVITPKSLYFTKSNGKLKGTLIVESMHPAIESVNKDLTATGLQHAGDSNSIELYWIDGNNREPCPFQLDGDPGSRILTIELPATSEVKSKFLEVVCRGGRFTKRLPVFSP
jgi:hypothetical protein